MSTVNFSVPEDVKKSFDAAFAGRNKSAVIAELMREAVAREASLRASEEAAQRILERHAAAPMRSNAQLRKARIQGAAVTRVVADASVALKWFFAGRAGEQDVEAALRLLRMVAVGAIELLQPPHFLAEVAAVLVREQPGTAHLDLHDLLKIRMNIVADAAHYALALTLAERHKQHVFDTLYHALALKTDNAVLVTADERYERQARAEGRIVKLVDWAPAR